MASLFNNKKLVRSKSGLRIVSGDNNPKSPFELGEPNWVPDKESSECFKCSVRFDFLTRRHHCRRCGQVFCNKCCLKKVPLPRMCFVDPVRLCEVCTKITSKENEFFNNHLKTLIAGANFQLKSDCLVIREEPESSSFYCRLSSNHREILFDGGAHSHHDAILLSKIAAIKLFKGIDFAGESDVCGAELTYTTGQTRNTLKLQVATVPNPKQSAMWIAALRQALKLVKDTEED